MRLVKTDYSEMKKWLEVDFYRVSNTISFSQVKEHI
jgi:hypothetical protein